MRRILFVGATSAIAEGTARLFAEEGDRLFLAARDTDKLQAMAADLASRGADRVSTAIFEALDYAHHESLVSAAAEALGGLDTLFVAHGTLPDQKGCESSTAMTRAALEINALSVISMVTAVANLFEAQRQGAIVVISSVAGDRGRRSNYVYGSAKACVNVFLEGLAHRLFRSGVHVLTVKPGFVDTPMTAAFEKGALWASPERVARDIHRAIGHRRPLLYTPWYWRWIMQLIRSMPTALFQRSSL